MWPAGLERGQEAGGGHPEQSMEEMSLPAASKLFASARWLAKGCGALGEALPCCKSLGNFGLGNRSFQVRAAPTLPVLSGCI